MLQHAKVSSGEDGFLWRLDSEGTVHHGGEATATGAALSTGGRQPEQVDYSPQTTRHQPVRGKTALEVCH